MRFGPISEPVSYTHLDVYKRQEVSGNKVLENIDFDAILQMAEKGVIGKLVDIESADGDLVEIYIE